MLLVSSFLIILETRIRDHSSQNNRCATGSGNRMLSVTRCLSLAGVQATRFVPTRSRLALVGSYRYASKESNSLQSSSRGSEVGQPTKFEKAREAGKTATNLAVIVAGVGVTCIMLYAVLRELLTSRSPSAVFGRALDRVRADTRVSDALGEPLAGFGEENSRGRRRHVSHLFFERNGVPHLRMRFYVQGSRKRATVHLEMQEDASGNFIYRYLFVQLDDYPRTVIVLDDNRHADAALTSLSDSLSVEALQ